MVEGNGEPVMSGDVVSSVEVKDGDIDWTPPEIRARNRDRGRQRRIAKAFEDILVAEGDGQYELALSLSNRLVGRLASWKGASRFHGDRLKLVLKRREKILERVEQLRARAIVEEEHRRERKREAWRLAGERARMHRDKVDGVGVGSRVDPAVSAAFANVGRKVEK